MHWLDNLPWWAKWAFMGGGGLMSAFASTILPVEWQAIGFFAGVLLCVGAGVGSAFHWITEQRQRRGEPRLKLEPSHFIILGLLIAAGGIVWQQFWWHPPITPKSGATPTTASGNPLQQAIDAFLAKRGRQATYGPGPAEQGTTVTMQDESDGTGPYIGYWDPSLGAWPTVADGFTAEQLRRSPTFTPTPLPRPLSAYEAELKVRAIDKVLDILSNDMNPLVTEGPHLQSAWWNALKDPKNNPTYWEDLVAYRDRFKQSTEKLETLRGQLPQYQDVIVAAQPTAYNSAFPAVERFMIAYNYVRDAVKNDAPGEAVRFFMKEPEDAFAKAIQDFAAWRNGARGRVLELRRQISP